MKLQPDQEILLKQQLCSVVLYKETFDEVYDHVLTCLEQQPAITNLYQQTHKILNEDFGGYAGICNMEKYRRDLVRSDIRSGYIGYVKTAISNPLIILLLLGFAAGYYLMGDIYKEFSVIQIATGLITAFIPYAFFWTVKQIRTFKADNLKDPISLAALEFDVSLPALWYLLFVISSCLIRSFFWNRGFRLAEQITDGINAILFVVIVFNVVLFFNVYYRKLKTSIN